MLGSVVIVVIRIQRIVRVPVLVVVVRYVMVLCCRLIRLHVVVLVVVVVDVVPRVGRMLRGKAMGSFCGYVLVYVVVRLILLSCLGLRVVVLVCRFLVQVLWFGRLVHFRSRGFLLLLLEMCFRVYVPVRWMVVM